MKPFTTWELAELVRLYNLLFGKEKNMLVYTLKDMLMVVAIVAATVVFLISYALIQLEEWRCRKIKREREAADAGKTKV